MPAGRMGPFAREGFYRSRVTASRFEFDRRTATVADMNGRDHAAIKRYERYRDAMSRASSGNALIARRPGRRSWWRVFRRPPTRGSV
jgi:hypothetical protein